MSPSSMVALIQEAVRITLLLSGPILLIAMVVGLTIALFQAVTQIQEMTLTFVPKIFAVLLAILFLSGWMVTMMVDYTHNLIVSIPNLVR